MTVDNVYSSKQSIIPNRVIWKGNPCDNLRPPYADWVIHLILAMYESAFFPTEISTVWATFWTFAKLRDEKR